MMMQNISAPRLNQELSVPKKPGQIKSEPGSSLIMGWNANQENIYEKEKKK